MARKRRFVRGSRETNRYFHPDIPLRAPQNGYRLPGRSPLFDQSHVDAKWFGAEMADNIYEGSERGKLMGKKRFAYPVMALLVRKEYGDIDAALQDLVMSEEETVHEPFVTKQGDDFYCPPQQALINPFAGSAMEQKTYDPSKNESISKQLVAGRAEKEGDIFEWRSTAYGI